MLFRMSLLDAGPDDYSSRIDALQAQVKAKDAEIENFQKRLDAATNLLAAQMEARKESEAKCDEMQQKVAELLLKDMEMKQSSELREKQVKDLQEQLERLASVSEESFMEGNAARQSEQAFKCQLDEARQREAEAVAEAKSAVADVAELQEQLEKTEQDLSELQKQSEIFKGIMEGERGEDAGKLKEKMMEKLHKKSQAEEQLEALIAQYEELERQNKVLKLNASSQLDKDSKNTSDSSAKRSSTNKGGNLLDTWEPPSERSSAPSQREVPASLTAAVQALPKPIAEVVLMLYFLYGLVENALDEKSRGVVQALVDQHKARKVTFLYLIGLHAITAYWYAITGSGDQKCGNAELGESLPVRPGS